MSTVIARKSDKKSPVSSPDNGLGLDNGPQGLMRAAVGFTEIKLEIPEDATLKQVEATLQLAITGYKRLSEASERLKPIIGRILLTVQERNLFKPDYKNFTAFLMDKVVGEMGLGRSNAFDSLKIARAFPSMTNEEYQRYGASRLLLAAKITDESKADFREVLTDATKVTVEEFKNRIKSARSVTATSYVISVRVAPQVKADWTALIESVEGTTPGELFGKLMDAYKATLSAGYTSRKPAKHATAPATQPAHAMAS